MSLLMDALRKAEEAKRQNKETMSHGEPDVTPVSEHQASALSLETRPLEMEPKALLIEPEAPLIEAAHTPQTSAELLTEAFGEAPAIAVTDKATPAPAESPQPKREPNIRKPALEAPQVSGNTETRDSIQNVFKAKQPEPKSNRSFLIITGSFTAVAVAAIAGYFWWQLQPRSAPLVLPTGYTAATPAAPLQTPATAVAALPALPTPEPAPVEKTAVTSAEKQPSSDKTLSVKLEPKAAPVAESPIRISNSTPKLNASISQGYEALQKGDLKAAQHAYERALAADSRNLDTLYGLASIALQRGNNNLAEDYYFKILELDPRDAVALSAMTGLRGKANGSNAESRLKGIIAEQPNVAALHLALGNLYAQDERWRDAQQSYFLALKNDSESPDAAYNLAVSLDQLRQDKLAIQYYNEALRLANNRPSNFNRAQIQARLKELQAP
ncbi:MAG: tetratricopeptide repeat protein [Rhodocyclaceae bacterium]|nr:tetratricopeptide repeat protein [Rhodocyclaceae bacterium]